MDEIIQFLQESTETGKEFALLGPFAVFSVKGVGDHTTQTASPASSQLALTSLNESNVDLGDPLNIEDIMATQEPLPLTPTLAGSHMYDYGTDLFAILDPPSQENINLNNSLNTLPTVPQDTSLSGLSTQQMQLNVAPSPLSLHLPLSEPSEILKRIPKDTFYLLEYYGSKMLFLLSPLPNHKPPWKIMHHPAVLETTSALLTAEPVKHAQSALLYSILAVCSFHIDWCTNMRVATGGDIVDRTHTAWSYWWESGKQFQHTAKVQLQLSLRDEFTGASKAKYKHILMTLLCMVTICVSIQLSFPYYAHNLQK